MNFDYDKFYHLQPMRYFDAGANINSEKAEAMLTNKNNNYIATMKSDGEWCRIIVDVNRTVAQSRNISKVTGEYGDKTLLIPHIIEEVKQLPNGTVLLGELCFAEWNSTARDVGTILRCKPEKAVERQKKHSLIYRIFDCLSWDGESLMDKPFEYRFNTIYNQIAINHSFV